MHCITQLTQIWSKSSFSQINFISTIKNFYFKSDIFLLKYVFQTALYGVWCERNQRKHGEAPTPPAQLILVVGKRVRNRFSSFRGIRGHDYEMGMFKWFATI